MNTLKMKYTWSDISSEHFCANAPSVVRWLCRDGNCHLWTSTSPYDKHDLSFRRQFLMRKTEETDNIIGGQRRQKQPHMWRVTNSVSIKTQELGELFLPYS